MEQAELEAKLKANEEVDWDDLITRLETALATAQRMRDEEVE